MENLERATNGQGTDQFHSSDNIEEHFVMCLEILKRTISIQANDVHKLLCIASIASGKEIYELGNADEAIEIIRDEVIDPILEFIDERLDSRDAIIGVLKKYKQRCEWFYRQRMREAVDQNLEGKSGERALMIDLNSYVHQESLEFFVEPASASGEADVVLRDSDGRYIIIDGKYIDEKLSHAAIRAKLASGFHQVCRYCQDYDEPLGYLVAFIRQSTRIQLECEQSDGLSYLQIGGKIIYFLEIFISDEPSASKSGVATEIVLTKEELVKTEE
ncbi:hypothetical protein KKC97_02800 [bacterium]|nr:hypothetical protein [bacterium]